MKYWTEERVRKTRERERRAHKREIEKYFAGLERARTYSKGESAKNVKLMLDALGLAIRRKMLDRLKREGAMSLSKLAKPFRMKLTTALLHMRALERSGLVWTHKQGRIRICVYNKVAVEELAVYLTSRHGRLE